MLQNLQSISNAEEAIKLIEESCVNTYLEHLATKSTEKATEKAFNKNYYVVHSLFVKYEETIAFKFKDISPIFDQYF